MSEEVNTKPPNEDPSEGETPPSEVVGESRDLEPAGDPGTTGALGATKYVHAAFFVVGILTAFISGRILAGIWDALAAWSPAVHAVPQLLLYGEDERPSLMIGFGILIGIFTVVRMFRNTGIRKWSDDVAIELSKVVWPNRETVTNGTIVVVVASALATLYIGLLDRFWGFVTTLVYGA